MTGRHRNNPQKFWERVSTGPNDVCWPWSKSIKNGYGRFTEGYKEHYAHRRAWELSRGPIPHGLMVLHRCNNKVCCNPFHLKLGTGKVNTNEAYRDGLCRTGERHPKAKLTLQQVRSIRADKRSQVKIAAEHGVGQATISSIQLGKSWKHEVGL